MMKRKNNPRLKPYKKWMSGKRGIYQRTVYIKNEHPYEFKIQEGGKLQVFARSKEEAIKKAKSWERWVRKKGHTNTVILKTIRKLR